MRAPLRQVIARGALAAVAAVFAATGVGGTAGPVRRDAADHRRQRRRAPQEHRRPGRLADRDRRPPAGRHPASSSGSGSRPTTTRPRPASPCSTRTAERPATSARRSTRGVAAGVRPRHVDAGRRLRHRRAPRRGEVTTGPNGTVTIDVPGVAGTVLARPFVLTYDGIIGADAHWVDRAPGGVSAGRDRVRRRLRRSAPARAGRRRRPAPHPTVTTTAIALHGAEEAHGRGPREGHRQADARPRGRRRRRSRRPGAARSPGACTSGADGSFSLTLPLSETTRVRAVAEGLGSQTLTVRMYSQGADQAPAPEVGHGRRVRHHLTEARRPDPLAAQQRRPGRARAPRRATAASSCASSIPGTAATRPSSSRAATAPSVPHRTLESSDEPSPRRSPPRSRRRARPPGPRLGAHLGLHDSAKKFEGRRAERRRPATSSPTTASPWSHRVQRPHRPAGVVGLQQPARAAPTAQPRHDADPRRTAAPARRRTRPAPAASRSSTPRP